MVMILAPEPLSLLVMPLKRLSLCLSLLFTAVAFFTPNHRRRKCLSKLCLSHSEDGITLELTKLLRNKGLRKLKEEKTTESLALNFERLLGKAEFANQTISSSSRKTNYRKRNSLLAEFDNLRTTSDIRMPQNDTLSCVQIHQNHTELSPYYRRDRRDHETMDCRNNNDIADPTGLCALLQVRFWARKDKDFDQIAHLDLQLQRQHGVRVSDYPRLWTRRTDASKASMRQRMRKRKARMMKLFGLLGHPYVKIKSAVVHHNASIIPGSHVHASLSALTRYQLEGRYDRAEAIKLELSLCGIRIHDQLLLWTNDANVEFEMLETIPDRVNEIPVYTEVKDDVSPNQTASIQYDTGRLRFGGRTMEEDILRRHQRIQQLLLQRSEADARGESTLFALITNELRSTYQVAIDDEQRTWRILKATPNVEESISLRTDDYTTSSFAALLFGEQSRDYTSDTTYRPSQKSLPIDNSIYQQRIEELVQERIHLREEGRYLEADAVRRELWHTYVSHRRAVFDEAMSYC
jgi:hypothetical protein